MGTTEEITRDEGNRRYHDRQRANTQAAVDGADCGGRFCEARRVLTYGMEKSDLNLFETRQAVVLHIPMGGAQL